MEIRLVVENGGRRQSVFRMRGKEMIIGRRKGCGLRVPSEAVSRDHCRLRLANGLLTIEDLNSTNGTRLNGERIHTRELLRPGDRLKVGPVTFVIEYAPDPRAINRMRAWEAERGVGSAAEFEPADDDVPILDADGPILESDVPILDADLGTPVMLEESGEDSALVLPLKEDELPLQLDEPMDLPPDDELRDFLSQLEEDEG